MLIETPTDTNANEAIGNAASARPARIRRTDFLLMVTSIVG
jgi:hypothetical protein